MSNHTRGISRMLVAVAFLSAMDVLVKLMADRFPAFQIAALRSAASLPVILAPLVVQRRMHELRPRRAGLHLARALLGLVMMAGFYYAVAQTSLANTYTLFMVAPLLVAVLSVPILGERVTAGGWLAVVVGLGGVALVLGPTTTGLTTAGAIAALLSAVGYAVNFVLVRIMTRTETSASLVFWFLLLIALISGLLAISSWRPLTARDWLLVAGIGITGAIGQHLITQAFILAPATLIAPFDYTALLWGLFFDFAIWSTRPSLTALAGASLIIGSGIYLVRSAHRDAAASETVATALPADPPI
jgi:drug/metabolite transporter (DMT)-like permease